MNSMKRNIPLLYTYQFLFSSVFFMGIIFIFLLAKGLNLTQIMILESLWAVLIVIFEIPTGIFADKYGLKLSILLTTLFITLGILLYAFAKNFWVFFFAQSIWAIGTSFYSGAFEALLYESNKYNFKKNYSNMFFISGILLFFTTIIGGYLYEISNSLPLILSAGLFGLTIFIIPFIKEQKKHAKIKTSNLKKILDVFIHLKENLLIFIISFAVFSAIGSVTFVFIQPMLQTFSVPAKIISMIFAVTGLVYSFGNKLGKYFKIEKLSIAVTLIALNYVIISFFPNKLTLVIFTFIAFFIYAIANPAISEYINKKTKVNRATTLSTISFLNKTTYAIIATPLGFLYQKTNIGTVFITLAGITLISAILLKKK